MYADDNNDFLPANDFPFNLPNGFTGSSTPDKLRNWVVGTMEQPFDAANVNILTCPQTQLSPYIPSQTVYHCPTDNYIDPNTRKIHARSYSMNSAVGTQWAGPMTGQSTAPVGSAVGGGWLPGKTYTPPPQNQYLTYGKMSSFTTPGPSSTWVTMDENAYSINDDSMAISAYATTTGGYLIDFPSANHASAAGISFADGHSIMHTWVDPGETCNPQKYGVVAGLGGNGGSSFSAPNDLDCPYLAYITSAPVQ